MPDPYLALKAEIAKPAYSGLDAAAIVAALNAPGAAVPRPIPAAWMPQAFASLGLRGTIEDLAKDTQSPLRDACLSLQDFFWGVGAGRVFDVTDPSLLAMLDGFVAAGKMTADQRLALVNLNAQPGPSIAQGLGFPRGVMAPDLDTAGSR